MHRWRRAPRRTALVTVAILCACMGGTVATVVTGGAPASAAAGIGPYNVDVFNREDVRQFYNVVHEATNDTPVGWTGGSVDNCVPGSVSPQFLAATLSRTNWFRAMAGEPGVTYNGTDAGTSADPNNATSQAAALMEAANPPNGVGHVPPQAGTKCWTLQAFNGTRRGNLAWGGALGVNKVDGLVYDGSNLGHRRNMLDPSISVMGAGGVPATTAGPTPFFTHMVLTTPSATRPPVRSGFVAWPNEGFFPYQVVPNRWSFSLPGADFSNASVTMKRNGNTVPVLLRCFDPWPIPNDPNCGLSAEPHISWSPNNMADGATWPKPTADEPYTVTVSNVVVGGAAKTFTYLVTLIDPAVSDPSHTLTQAPQGPAQPVVNTNPAYTVAPAADTTGYQWRTTALTPGTVFDDAENGLGNWTPAVTPAYDPVSTSRAAAGNASFRLAAGSVSGSPPDQTLTLNRSLLATATSKLSFDSLYFWVNSEAATVEVSTDSGATWVPAFEEHPIGQFTSSAFDPKVVPLGQFAGHLISVRFHLSFDNSGGWGDCCDEPGGWYFDNVSFTDVQSAGTPTVAPVGANPSFTMQNPQAGTLALDVRPRFSNLTFGSSLGSWSPVKLVTSVIPTASGTSLTSSANPSDNGQEVTYTATVSPTSGDGHVAFKENGTPISGCESVALTAGKATCKQTYFFGADRSIVATYTGDSTFTDSSSPPLQQIVTAPALWTGTLVTSDDHVEGGEPITFTATVNPTDGGGTIAFTDNNATIPGCGAVPLTAAGQATCTMVSQGPEHSLIEAVYSGDANFIGQPVGNLLQNVTAFTSTALSSSANPSSAGQEVTYTATLTPSTTFGSVTFTDNGQVIPFCQNLNLSNAGDVTCATTYASNGPHAVQAFFSGWGGLASYAPSTSAVLAQSVGGLAASSTALASSANPAVTGQQVTYTATVTASDKSGGVLFTDAGNPIAGCESVAVNGSGTASCAQTYAGVGSHPIVASYLGASGTAVSSSSTVTQTVNDPTPAAPQGVDVTNVGGGATEVGFGNANAPSLRAGAAAPGYDITGYNVYVGTSPSGESSTPVNPSRILTTAKGFTVTGLNKGTKYYFVVRSTNHAGVGAKSAEVSTTPATAPTAARTLAALAGNGNTKLTWTAPASTGGSAVTGYYVFLGTRAGGESTKPLNAYPLPASARSLTAAGLTNGTKYFFVVRAINAVGISPSSNEVSATPAGPPAAPLFVSAYPAKASVGLRWGAPALGGGPITGFNVYKGTASGGESATPVNASPLSPSSTSYSATALTNGTKYFFTVKAINGSGASKASAEVSATPTASSTAPSPPRTLKAKGGNHSAALTWTAPASNGGKPITGFNVYEGSLANYESATPVNASPLAAGATSYTVTGLPNGATAFVTVKAINSVGKSAASNEASARPEAPSTVPSAPLSLALTAGSAKVTLKWKAPAWNGGSAVTGFNVYRGTASGLESATPVNASPLSASATSYTATGLTNGKRYYFVVKAINGVGTSDRSGEESTTPY